MVKLTIKSYQKTPLMATTFSFFMRRIYFKNLHPSPLLRVVSWWITLLLFGWLDGVPLVIPEVNPEAMADYKLGKKKGGIIANPNCSR